VSEFILFFIIYYIKNIVLAFNFIVLQACWYLGKFLKNCQFYLLWVLLSHLNILYMQCFAKLVNFDRCNQFRN